MVVTETWGVQRRRVCGSCRCRAVGALRCGWHWLLGARGQGACLSPRRRARRVSARAGLVGVVERAPADQAGEVRSGDRRVRGPQVDEGPLGCSGAGQPDTVPVERGCFQTAWTPRCSALTWSAATWERMTGSKATADRSSRSALRWRLGAGSGRVLRRARSARSWSCVVAVSRLVGMRSVVVTRYQGFTGPIATGSGLVVARRWRILGRELCLTDRQPLVRGSGPTS